MKPRRLVVTISKGGAMMYYRLYYFGGPNGRIDHFREFEALHDAAAITQSGEWRSVSSMELWSGRRK